MDILLTALLGFLVFQITYIIFKAEEYFPQKTKLTKALVTIYLSAAIINLLVLCIAFATVGGDLILSSFGGKQFFTQVEPHQFKIDKLIASLALIQYPILGLINKKFWKNWRGWGVIVVATLAIAIMHLYGI